MAHHLTKAGVDCTYTMVHSLSYVIGEVTKVFLGAHAVMANGYVMSRVGTSQVAMIAKVSYHQDPLSSSYFIIKIRADSSTFGP